MGERDDEIRDQGWPCACTRTRGGQRQIKINAPEVTKCRTCKATRAEAERMAAEFRKDPR